MMTQIETGRTHQVADILDEEDIQLVQRHPVEPALHQMRIQMAGGAGGDLVGRDAQCANPGRVVFGFEISLDHADANPALKPADGGFQ